MSSVSKILSIYQRLFARKPLYKINKLLYLMSLRGLGIFNYENDVISGESNFLTWFASMKPDPVVLDVGANRGNYSSLIKSVCPNAHVYSFEPHPLTFKRLELQAGKDGFVALNLGLGNSEGSFTLYDYADQQEGSEHASLFQDVIQSTHKSEALAWQVELTTIDKFVSEQDLQHIDLLKIDTEGNELNVLKGAAKCLQQKQIGTIHFEFNEMNVVSRSFFKDFYELLGGYKFYRMLQDGLVPLKAYDPIIYEIFAFQNVVAISEDRLDSVIS